MYRIVSLLGFAAFLGLAWLLSENRRVRHWRILLWAAGLQWAVGLLVLKFPPGRWVFERCEDAVDAVIAASDHGARFLFGSLVSDLSIGAVLAFRVLPIVVFVSALASVLYHWRVVQKVVKALAWVMRRTMRISGLEALGSALFVFFGIESVTGLKGYLEKSTRSEMFLLMTAFMATIAGSVMGAYAAMGVRTLHLLTASLMSAPAAVAVAKLMVPETETPSTAEEAEYEPPVDSVNTVDALSSGAVSGLSLALNIGACLMAFVGGIYLLDLAVGYPFRAFEIEGVSLESAAGYLMSPFALLMGVPWEDALTVGRLLGVKTVVNEFVAYQGLQEAVLSPRARVIATYALCGFANFGSVAILTGGMSTLAPKRRGEVAKLGMKALIGGTLAAFLTACVAGVLA